MVSDGTKSQSTKLGQKKEETKIMKDLKNYIKLLKMIKKI